MKKKTTTRKPKTPTLPDKPSELIRVALADLRKVERSEKYKVDMGNWHGPGRDGRCHVCLAGSVMAKTLKYNPDDPVIPVCGYGDGTGDKLHALDNFREGLINHGLSNLSLPETPWFNTRRHICRYEDNREAFFRDMNDLADELEGNDL